MKLNFTPGEFSFELISPDWEQKEESAPKQGSHSEEGQLE